mgnify:CR=1 FL=1
MSEKSTFYLVREEILPEAIKKTIKVKEILKRGEIKTINEAVEKMGHEPQMLITNIRISFSRSMKQARKKLLPCPYCWSTNPVCCPRS